MNKNVIKKKWCPTCRAEFTYSNNDVKQDEKGSYGSTKYVQCPECGKTFILQVIEDAYDNINDLRFYSYKKR